MKGHQSLSYRIVLSSVMEVIPLNHGRKYQSENEKEMKFYPEEILLE
ncbi:hypothetical protein [Rossellomorea vietnamensis]